MSKRHKKRNARRRKGRSSQAKASDAASRAASVAAADQPGSDVQKQNSIGKLGSQGRGGDSSTILFESPTPPLLLGLLIIAVATPAIFGPYGQRGGYSPDVHMAAYIQVVSFLVLTIAISLRKFSNNLEVPKAPPLLPFALLFAWAMLSVLWTIAPYEAITDALDWVGAFVTGFLVLLIVKNIESIRKLMEAVAISGFLLSVLGALQFLIGVDWVQQHVVPATTFSNKNMAGQYTVMTLPLMAAMFLISKDVFRIWFYAFAIALGGAFVIYTRARGAWVGTSFGIILFLIFMAYMVLGRKYTLEGKHKRIAAVLIIPVFLGLSYLTPQMLGTSETVKKRALGEPEYSRLIYETESGPELLKKTLSDKYFNATKDVRLTIWINSIPMFLDHPWLGVGIGNWTVYYAAYQSWFKQDIKYTVNQYHANAHNDYVELICELGLVGLILMLWCFISLFIVLKALIFSKDTYDATHTIMVGGLVVALAAIGVNAVFSFPLKQPVPIMLIITYIALLCCMYSIKVSQTRHALTSATASPVKSKVYVLSVLRGVAAVITVSLVFLHYNWFQSEVYYRNLLGISKSGGDRQHTMLKLSRLAHSHMPWRDRLLWSQATALLQLQNVKEALPLFKRVLASYPYQQNSLQNITSAYMMAGNVPEAFYYYDRLHKIQGEYVLYHHKIKYIDLLLKKGLYERALEESENQYGHYKYIFDRMVEDEIEKAIKKGEELKASDLESGIKVGLQQSKAEADRFKLLSQYARREWDALKAERASAATSAEPSTPSTSAATESSSANQ